MAIRGRAPGVGASPRQARGSRLRAAQQPARLPPGIASVLSVLSSSAVVLDSNDRVLRASVYLTSLGDFQTLNAIYAERFGDHKPARTTVQVSALPKGGAVEIDLIALL